MNINEFIKRMNEASPVFSIKRMKELNKSLITRDKKITTGNFQFAVIIEEYCELLEAIEGTYTSEDFSKLNDMRQYSIVEELADAYIVTNQLQILFGYAVPMDLGGTISRYNFDEKVISPISRVIQVLTKKLRGYEECDIERLIDDIGKIYTNVINLACIYGIDSDIFSKAVNVKVNRGIARLREAAEPEFQNDIDTKKGRCRHDSIMTHPINTSCIPHISFEPWDENHLGIRRDISSDQTATEWVRAAENFRRRFLLKK